MVFGIVRIEFCIQNMVESLFTLSYHRPLISEESRSWLHLAGRHFLQIPGPTNVPERVLRAIDSPTIDHRGPEFQRLGQEVLAGMKQVFKTRGRW